MMPHTRVRKLACREYGIYERVKLQGNKGEGAKREDKTTAAPGSERRFQQNAVFVTACLISRREVLDFLEFVLTDFGLIPADTDKVGMLLQLNRGGYRAVQNWEEDVASCGREAQNLSWEQLWKRFGYTYQY